MGKITINQDALRSAREWKRHKIQEGSNIYRILPPFGELEVHKNYPYRKWSIAWLLDPRTGGRRPFATPLTDGEERCPVKEYQDALREYIDKKKAMMEAEGASKGEVKDALKALYEVQWQIKVQHLYTYNACDKAGNVGLLELKSTAHKAMKKKMMEYIQTYGQDPTSLNSDLKDDAGVWFNITKEGSGKDTEYNVEFNQMKRKTETGEVLITADRTSLSENVVQNYAELGYDLNTVYRRKNYDDLRKTLLYTLAVLAEDVPEVILPGYEDASSVSSETSKDESDEEVVASKPAKTSSKVSLNLSGDDDDDEDYTPVKTAKAKPASMPSDIEDLKSFADQILGD